MTSRSNATLDPSSDVTSRAVTPPRLGRRQRARSADPLRSRTTSSDHLSTTSTTNISSSTSSSIHKDLYRDRSSLNFSVTCSEHCRSSDHSTYEGKDHPPSSTTHLHHDKHYYSDLDIHQHHNHHHHHHDDNDPDPPRRRRRRRHQKSQPDHHASESSLPSSYSYYSDSASDPSGGSSSSKGGCPESKDALNLSLCGCGFLGVYHLGVVTSLLKHGPSFLERVDKVAGASAGALAAALLVTAPTLRHVESCTDLTGAMAKKVRRKPLGALTPGYRLSRDVREMLDTVLPPDAHLRASGRLQVSLTDLAHKTNRLVSHFESRDHLIECLVASCHIPVYSGVKPPKVQGKAYCAGGLTNNLVQFSDGRTVTVSPFSGRQDIGPRDPLHKGTKGWFFNLHNQDLQVNMNNLRRLSHAFFPPRRSLLQQYFELGQKDASRFLVREGLYEIRMPPEKPPLMYESSV